MPNKTLNLCEGRSLSIASLAISEKFVQVIESLLDFWAQKILQEDVESVVSAGAASPQYLTTRPETVCPRVSVLLGHVIFTFSIPLHNFISETRFCSGPVISHAEVEGVLNLGNIFAACFLLSDGVLLYVNTNFIFSEVKQ